ncbi:hypothetical protein [Rahnella woolbedingensis]|uniref:hypothetical protein n=1 Tax=Rahnella woolbedingensis TaxID=1510574 RepID=UPI00142E7F79|nr:hypothetical protein [Rahnella woolbedingensis]
MFLAKPKSAAEQDFSASHPGEPCTKISEAGTAKVQFPFIAALTKSQNPDNTHE